MPDLTETERLFRVYHEQMIALAIALLHDEEEARDTVSDVMERLVKGTLHLPLERTEAYLMTAVRNQCLDRIRRLSLREKIRRIPMHCLHCRLKQSQSTFTRKRK